MSFEPLIPNLLSNTKARETTGLMVEDLVQMLINGNTGPRKPVLHKTGRERITIPT